MTDVKPGDIITHPVHGKGRVWEVNALTLEAVVLYDLGAGLPLPERFRAKRLPIAWCEPEGGWWNTPVGHISKIVQITNG